jgi:DNA-binding beta-propeller fold protein YncE
MDMKDGSRMRYSNIILRGLGFMLMFCVGCSSPQGEVFPVLAESLVWPKPPEQPRVKYVGALSTEADLKKEVSWFQSVGEFVFGKEDIGILVGPYAVAIDEDKRLFVADAGSGLVQAFDLSKRRYNQFSAISGEETLQMPVALTLADNRIYVADSVLRKVCVLKRPAGIAHWQEANKVYVADAVTHIVNVFDESGKFLFEIGTRGINAGQFNFPTHLWVDKSGLLYVSDTLNYRVQVFTGDGKFLKMVGEHGNRPGYFAHPCGIAADSAGRIYVTDRQFENFQIFDSDGRILLAIGGEGSGLGEFWLPAGVFIDDRNRIYIADSFNKRIQVFELLGVSENEE